MYYEKNVHMLNSVFTCQRASLALCGFSCLQLVFSGGWHDILSSKQLMELDVLHFL